MVLEHNVDELMNDERMSQNETSKTKNPKEKETEMSKEEMKENYTGSKEHQVKPEEISSFLEADEALKRLKKRYSYLSKRIEVLNDTIKDSGKSTAKREAARTQAIEIKKEFEEIKTLKDQIDEMLPELEKDIVSQFENFDPNNFTKVTF